MKRILSFFSILLLLNNVFLFSVFAAVQISLNSYSISVNWWNYYNSNIEAKPGDTLYFSLDAENIADTITNVEWVFSFSTNSLSYSNPWEVDSFVNWYIEKENIDTASFYPTSDNRVLLADSIESWSLFALHHFDLTIDSNISNTYFTTTAQINSSEWTSSTLTRNIFVDTRPHITNYYFSKNNSIINQLSRWWEQVDFVIEVKDYNWCSNIDNATVNADLSKLWLSDNESLVFDSCSNNVAIYKKNAISTIILPTDLTFSYTDFSVIDEDWNSNLPNDSQTSFDDIDKKDTLNFTISSAWTPDIIYSVDDNIIWWDSNLVSNISFSGSQNWDIKISLWWDSECNNWTIISDWSSYLANSTENFSINSNILSEGLNTIYICLKNDEDLIWNTNFEITKDITNPEITWISVWPINIVTQDSRAAFVCSENWETVIEKWWNWTLWSGLELSRNDVIYNIENSISISNSDLDLDDNIIYIYCIDEAGNNVWTDVFTINKTTPPPSFAWETVSFSDNDIDYDWLDWRDLSFSWSNLLWTSYNYFSSYVLYLIPSNIELDTNTHQNIKIILDSSTDSFLWDSSILNDSLWNTLVWGSSYKMCILVNWTNWLLWEEKCSDPTVLTSDVVSHPLVLSARFNTDTNLEITTDTILDTDLSNHSGSLISYTYNWNTYNWLSVSSVDWKKINIQIPSLSNNAATGTNLLLLTWALRAATWWFNDNQTFSTINDGQSPLINPFTLNTSSVFNNFYNWILNFSYTLWEEMLTSNFKFELSRIWWNLDSNIYIKALTWPFLLAWAHTTDLDLSSLWLTDWTNYQIKLVWKDLSSNYWESSNIWNIKYDSTWPSKITQNITSLYSTLTPELSWQAAVDNLWNGSWIKNYKLDIYNWNNCVWTINQTHTLTTTSKIINPVWNIADYSWKVVAIDNLDNVWEESDCSNFRVDTSVPAYTDSKITDINLSSSLYLKEWNNLEVSSKITDTDINHIWLDLSMLTWTWANSNELCASPSVWISCSYTWSIVKYSFTAASSIIDWIKQVLFNSQNTSWGNDTTKVVSITADSNAPIIQNDAFLSPTWIVWWTWTLVTWNSSKITDTIWLDYLQVEYSTWAWIWNLIWTWSNNWSIDWDLTSVDSGLDYKIRLTAFDEATNNSNIISWIFEVDRTDPVVLSDTIIYPNWWEVLGWSWAINILWNTWSITDKQLATNPVNLSYSNDWSTWFTIAENLANNGEYIWNHWNLNFNNLIIKLTAFDSVWNFSSDESDSSFIIDTIKPSFSFNFAQTPVLWSYINNSWFDLSSLSSDIYFDRLDYSFQNIDSGEYFNWTIFTWTTEINNTICNDWLNSWTDNSCDTSNFTLVSPIIDWNNYRLFLKAIDEAWNETISLPLDYIWDTINPEVSISTASWTYFKDSITINWTSSDIWSWVWSVKVQIKKWTDYWDGSNFVSTIQTLNTETSNNYSDWSYDFSYNWDDWEYEIIAIAYDKSYKVNNNSQTSIIVNKDATIPEILWGSTIFSSPLLWDIYIWWTNIDILWNSWSISDNWSWLATNPITIEYFNWTDWIEINNNELNDWEYSWISDLIDSNIVKIRLSVTDNVWNIAYVSSDKFTIDSTPPSISSVETMDLDADWQIDALNVIMSEDIKDSSIDLTNFTISNWIWTPLSFETGNSVDDESFVLKFSNFWDTSTTPSLSYTKWTLVDIAWKFLETDTYTLSIDKASPRLLKSEIFDEDENAKFDKIVATFSEDLSWLTDTSAWSFDNALNWLSVSSVSISWNELTINLNEWTDFITSVWSMKINFSSNWNYVDYSWNQAGSIVSWDIIDLAKPVVYKAEYYDLDSNYKVDRVVINYSEDVQWFIESDFSFDWLIKSSWNLSWDSISFDITETTSDNDTWVDAYFDFASWNLKDLNDNLSSSLNSYSIWDKVEAKLISKETNDSNWNWRIDSVILTYSEDLNSNFDSFVAEVDWYNISWYSKLNLNQISLDLTEKDNFDTNASPLVKISSNSSISDLNENLVSSFSFESSDDKVWVVITWARYDDLNHKIFISWSETINSSDFIASNFVLSNAWSYSIDSVNFSEKSITVSWETINYWTTAISFVWNSVSDSLGNMQADTFYTKIAPPIVINEIMLSNNSSDNYIELRNLSDSSVDISWYTIWWVTIPNSTSISWSWYYLIAKDNETNSVLNISPDLVDNSLNISGTQLVLNNWFLNIDFASLTTWLFDNISPKSVERKDNIWDWLLSSSWYTAQTSVWFDNNTVYWTPKTWNIYDNIVPTISSYIPWDDLLLNTWNFDIIINYADNIWGLWINNSSDTLSLQKWNWTTWWSDISSSYVDFWNKLITSTSSTYNVSNLEYWKYRINFSISDNAWNIVNKTIVFYVDEFSFSIDKTNLNIWQLISWFNTFSTDELVIIIETVWAWFDLEMLKNWLFNANWTDIIDFDWDYGFGYDLDNWWYTWNINSFNISWVNIDSISKNININWNKNIYTYRIKYWAKIDVTQAAWYYEINPIFNIIPKY